MSGQKGTRRAAKSARRKGHRREANASGRRWIAEAPVRLATDLPLRRRAIERMEDEAARAIEQFGCANKDKKPDEVKASCLHCQSLAAAKDARDQVRASELELLKLAKFVERSGIAGR